MNIKKNKLAAITAYDYSFAKIFDECGMDIILVGDSLGNVIKGEQNTLSVTIENMVYHTKQVAKGVKNALLIADMPYLSYEEPKTALANAQKLIQAGAQMVKLEGAKFVVIENLIANNIRVCSHLGLEPQLINILGYKVQGKDEKTASSIINNALKLEKIGVELLVLECIPAKLGEQITNMLKINTIGIGAGIHTDGQILVCYDMLGISDNKAKFVKNFAVNKNIKQATQSYIKAIKNHRFPSKKNSYQ